MPLTPGTRLGPYEIADQLGVGGMGEVYRARDTERRYYSAVTGRSYDVSLDGQRFLMIREGGSDADSSRAPQIIVVLNWFEELKRLVPTGR